MHRITRLLATVAGALLLGVALTVVTAGPAAASPGAPSCTGLNTTALTLPSGTATSSSTTIENCDRSFTGTMITLDLHFTAGTDLSFTDIALTAPNGTGYHLVHCAMSCMAIGADSSTRYFLSTTEVLAGTWTLAITYRGYAGPKLTSWQVAVDMTKPPTGCYGTNPSDYRTGNLVTDSPIHIACNGHAAANTTVEVHLSQPALSQFRLYLVAANGDEFLLQPSELEYEGTALNDTFTVNASAEGAYEVWRLRIEPGIYSSGPFPAGLLDSWSLNVAPVGPSTAFTGSNNASQEIWDSGAVGSTIAVSGIAGNASNHSTARVRVTPSKQISYLTFFLIAPDGTRYLLGQTDYDHVAPIDVTYPVNPSLKLRNGTWRLDAVPSGPVEGYGVASLDGWTLTV